MTDERSTDLLGALPRTRPHRRSDKRSPRSTEAKPSATKVSPTPLSSRKAPSVKSRGKSRARKSTDRPAARRLRQPAQPAGIPRTPRVANRKPAPTSAAEIVGIAFQAVGELAEIGLSLGSRALRNAVSRLPRP